MLDTLSNVSHFVIVSSDDWFFTFFIKIGLQQQQSIADTHCGKNNKETENGQAKVSELWEKLA